MFKDCHEKFPELLVFGKNQNTEDEIRNGIDVTEAGDMAEDFNVYKNYGINNSITTKVVPNNQEGKDPPMDGLELWFSSQDFRTEFDIVEDTIIDSNIRIELVFKVKVLPPGKGFRTLFDSDLDSDSECTVISTTIKHYSKHNEKELDAKISLIIGRKDNEKIDVLHSYLNGIKRRMLVDRGRYIGYP